MKIISSLQNSHFKRLKRLSNNKLNKKEGEFIIEGVPIIDIINPIGDELFPANTIQKIEKNS